MRPSRKRHALLASLLREVRVEAGLRQVDVADRLGQPQSYVSKYESGERTLSLLELEVICDALDVDLLEFIRRYTAATE
jgi:transcriptional regulator with XRE-family HTH domain